MNPETLAHNLYDDYCTAVGGVAFNGDPLPSSQEFFADESKKTQADAWRQAAENSLENLTVAPATMRAKMKVTKVTEHPEKQGSTPSEDVEFIAVGPDEGYPEDGSDENNTFAKWTPSADLKMSIMNPALFGKHKVGDEFYLDFTKA